MKDYYFKGIHYQVKNSILSAEPIVQLYDSDFKQIRDYILDLEWRLHCATGETFSGMKTKSET